MFSLRLSNFIFCCALAMLATLHLLFAGELAVEKSTVSFPIAEARKAEKLAAAEYVGFAEKIVADLETGDGSFLDDALDVDGFVESAVRQLPLTKKETREISIGLRKGVIGLGTKIVAQQASENVEVVLLRCVELDGSNEAHIRITSEKGAVWFIFYLVKKADGRIFYNDIYTTVSGCRVSESVCSTVLSICPKRKNKNEDSPLGGDKVPEEDAVTAILQKLLTLKNEGDLAGALQQYYKLPEKIRKEYSYQAIGFSLAVQLGSESPEYDRILEEIYETNRGNPAASFTLVDYYYSHKEFNKVRECLRSVMEHFGPDGYLALLTGEAYREENNIPMALAWLHKGQEVEPKLYTSYDYEADIYLKAKEYVPLRKLWCRIQRLNPNMIVEDVLRDEQNSYQSFIADPEFAVLSRECAQIRRELTPPTAKKKSANPIPSGQNMLQ